MKMNDQDRYLETVWDGILSRDSQKIREIFASLDQDSQETIRAHLKRMVGEEGWHPEQILSARYALQALNEKPKNGN
jgi:hypothetical protein